jgi:hypothetical protein
LVSQLREDLLLCSSYLPLGVPNGLLLTNHQAFFLALLPRRKKIFARGVSHAQSFTLLLFCFILFLLASFYQKYKKLVPTIVVISVGLLLSCFIMLSINGWFL